MTREQEIKEMAKTIASHITSDKDMQVAFADVLRRGAEWADRTMIDKACEWLDDYLTFSVAEWDEGVTTQRVIDKFRKAMEGE